MKTKNLDVFKVRSIIGIDDGFLFTTSKSNHELWNINHKDFDESLTSSGFHTKSEAVEWLKEAYEKQEDWLFNHKEN